MNILSSALTLAMLLSAAPAPEAPLQTCHQCKVVSVSERPPFHAGYIETYYKVQVQGGDGAGDYYLTYLSDDLYVPAVDALCDIDFYTFPIQGYAGQSSVKLASARVVSDMRCR